MGGFRPDASSRIPVMALAALTALNGSVWPNLEDGPKVALAVLESLGPSFQVGGPIGRAGCCFPPCFYLIGPPLSIVQ
jgi:hypothetical protein